MNNNHNEKLNKTQSFKTSLNSDKTNKGNRIKKSRFGEISKKVLGDQKLHPKKEPNLGPLPTWKKVLIAIGAFFKRFSSVIIGTLLTFMLIGIITGMIVGVAFGIYCKTHLIEDYDIPSIKFDLSMTTSLFYYDKQNDKYVEMPDQRLYGTENRFWASVQDMPVYLKKAFVAIEDKRFYENDGVDWRRTFGAFLQFVSGQDSYGGSTITQQLIKNITNEDQTTIQRKVQEIFRALSLSKKRSKDEILEMYLNTINLSRGNYGVQTASNYYFGKDVSKLSLIECAALASIPKSPTKYDPVRNPEENKKRRDVVLLEMYKAGWIKKADYDGAVGKDLTLNITVRKENTTTNSYFTDALIEQLIVDLEKKYGYSREIASTMIYSGGLKIYTTVDPRIQGIMETAFEDPATFPKSSDSSIYPQSAMVVMDPYTGDVAGIVGGRGEKSGNRGLNRATMSKRQIGSSIKPISVYAPAMDLGLIKYSTIVKDSPFKYDEKLKRNWPVNSPNVYSGNITINYAIEKSKNTIAVKTLDKLTPQYSYDFLTKKLGITNLAYPADVDLAPLALGGLTYGLSVMEVTAAYSIFPNGGVYSAPRLYSKVLDSEGNEILTNKVRQNVAVSEATAEVMTSILQNVLNHGTGTAVSLRRSMDVAGKTGSTNEDKDRYFVGFTPYYVGACWFGADTPVYLGSKFSGNPALSAWNIVMTKIHEDMINDAKNGNSKLQTFDYSNVVEASFCTVSGKLPGRNCSSVEKGFFAPGTEPTEVCTSHKSVSWVPDAAGDTKKVDTKSSDPSGTVTGQTGDGNTNTNEANTPKSTETTGNPATPNEGTTGGTNNTGTTTGTNSNTSTGTNAGANTSTSTGTNTSSTPSKTATSNTGGSTQGQTG
jgi:penicillin-binding protein, 1A family